MFLSLFEDDLHSENVEINDIPTTVGIPIPYYELLRAFCHLYKLGYSPNLLWRIGGGGVCT